MIGVMGFASNVSRLFLCGTMSTVRNITTSTNPLCFGLTNVLSAEPLKKRRRVDPVVLRQREERRKRKIEKQIRRLEKTVKQLKPIDEIEIPAKLIAERDPRTRHCPPLSLEVAEDRISLQKAWTKYRSRQCLGDVRVIDSLLFSQQKALDELKAESEELYIEALQMDPSFIPYSTIGPVHTPPILNYDSPDGEYIDITTKYEGET